MKKLIPLTAMVAAFPALAENTRQLDAHEHGVGLLNVAIDGESIAMEFEAPGADIVGFEHPAENDEDKAAIASAIKMLAAPLELFSLPQAAACSVTAATANLISDDHDDHGDHDSEHDHDEHHNHDHEDEHDHDEHHDDHDHDDHDDHDDDHSDEHDHQHDDHAKEASHTEFRATYLLACENPDAVNTINFNYFETFPNSKEVKVQLITKNGANAYEVERDQRELTLDR